MTLRGRLTTAFLAVVLGPVLLGAFFVGGTVAAVSHERSVDRLGLAATSVRTSISALCRQLRAAADAVAAVTDPGGRANVADQVVTGGMASAVLITDPTGNTAHQTPDAPPQPWLDCARPAWTSSSPRGLTVRVEMRDSTGALLGSVAAAEALDSAFVGRLSASVGVDVTLLYAGGAIYPAYSTEPASVRGAVVRTAAGLRGDAVGQTESGRYVRRLGPVPGQPLPLALSAPPDRSPVLYAVLVNAVVLAGLFAVLAAFWLARSTTRPLAELADAADRVAGGDLAARVPVRTGDEVGHLASTFNRMTRETQAYVQALTASRDQLRGHLAILGDTLSSTHDLQRILTVILQTARAATSARAGVLLLFDQATGTLVGQVAEGLDELEVTAGRTEGRGPKPADVQVPLGSGMLGAVAATGEPQRGRVDRDHPVLSPAEPRCQTYIAVPVSAPGSVRARTSSTGTAGSHNPLPRSPGGHPPVPAGSHTTGPAGGPVHPEATRGTRSPESASWPVNLPPAQGVLALYDRLGCEEFDDSDLATLRTFAAQAAVAVDNVRMHHEAQRLSMTDPLTGLWNYRYLTTMIRREVERAGRFGRMLTVLALDLDRFKEVNDSYGHAAGDAVLVEFARRIRSEIREVDLAFRQGGEEFVVLLPETDSRGGAIVAERLGAAVRTTPIMVQAHGDPSTAALSPVRVSVSIGVAVYPDHASTGQQVLDAADDALYAAKAAGRDTYRVAVPRTRPAPEEIPVAAGSAAGDEGVSASGESSPGGTVAPAGGAGGRAGGASSAPQPPRQGRGR